MKITTCTKYSAVFDFFFRRGQLHREESSSEGHSPSLRSQVMRDGVFGCKKRDTNACAARPPQHREYLRSIRVGRLHSADPGVHGRRGTVRCCRAADFFYRVAGQVSMH